MPRKLVNLRMSDDELADLDRNAQAEGLDRSTYLRKRAKVTPQWLAQITGVTVTHARHWLNGR